MVTMAGLQVFVVRFFFQGARKGELSLADIGGSGRANRWRRIRMRDFLLANSSDKTMWEDARRRGGDVVLWIIWSALCRRGRVASHRNPDGSGSVLEFKIGL
jgi:hypothetical protein